MGVPKFLSKLQPPAQDNSQSSTPARSDSTAEKDNGIIDDSPVKYLTWRSFMLGICVSMGGFIFGYSTGNLTFPHLPRIGINQPNRSNLRFHYYGRLQEAVR